MKYTVVFKTSDLSVIDVHEGNVKLDGLSAGINYGVVNSDATPEIGSVISSAPTFLFQPSLSSKYFVNLFTKTELKSITKSNDADVGIVWLNELSATTIEPYGIDVPNGLAVLVSTGELTQARSDEILTQAKNLADAGCCNNSYATK